MSFWDHYHNLVRLFNCDVKKKDLMAILKYILFKKKSILWSFILPQNQPEPVLNMYWKQNMMDLWVKEHNLFKSRHHLPVFSREKGASKQEGTQFGEEPPRDSSNAISVMNSERKLSFL